MSMLKTNESTKNLQQTYPEKEESDSQVDVTGNGVHDENKCKEYD